MRLGIRTLVSMATESSHRGIRRKHCCHSSDSIFVGSSSFFQVTRTLIKSEQSSNFGHIGPRAGELAALE